MTPSPCLVPGEDSLSVFTVACLCAEGSTFCYPCDLGEKQERKPDFSLLNSPMWCFHKCFFFPWKEEKQRFLQRQRSLQFIWQVLGPACRTEPWAGSNLGGSRQECSSPIWANREIRTPHTFFFLCSERKINNPESVSCFFFFTSWWVPAMWKRLRLHPLERKVNA